MNCLRILTCERVRGRRIGPRLAVLLAAPLGLLVYVGFSTSGRAAEAVVDSGVGRGLPEVVTFNAHIRPLMSNTCFVCHGPDDNNNDSGFRVDSFAAATSPLPSDDDLVGIKPGDPLASQVYLRIMGQGDGEQMPPADFRHQLTEYDRALFKKWIEQGAEYQEHWAYAPLVRPLVPVPQKHAALVSNPIDAFILTHLERVNIEPTPLAERATLLRRLSLDLVGLPPSIEELKAFLADESAGAYERAVERLLASEHFGERMAADWLDLVRFADTVGFHGDQNQRVFPYRDYVIEAFNRNKPFDQFTREQIAGDLLPNPTEEQLIATGALRLNMVTREGGAQPGEYLAKYRADRVRTLGTAWLGATLGCCECHNHKYDPFTAKDFYAFGAFFDGLRQWGVYADYGYTPNADLNGFNNDFPFPPELRVSSPSLRAEIRAVQRERDTRLASALGSELLQTADYESWAERLSACAAEHAEGWVPAKIKSVSMSHSSKSEILDDGSLLLTGGVEASEKVTVVADAASDPTAGPQLVSALRVEVLPDERHAGFVGRGPAGQFMLSVEVETVPAEVAGEPPATAAADADAAASPPADGKVAAARAVKIAWTEVDRGNPLRYKSGEPVVDDKWRSGPAAWQLPSDEAKLPHTAVYHFAEPLQLSSSSNLVVRMHSGDIGRVRLSFSAVADAMPGWPALSGELHAALSVAAAERSPAQAAVLISAYHRSTQPVASQHPLCGDYRNRLLALHAGQAMSMVAQAVPAERVPTSRVLRRGNWQDRAGELAPPSFPAFLPQPERSDARELTRLDLANWLTSASNPMTPRHFVNRTWKHFFGAGLSAKVDDLGNQGEWPSHPLLLDWLAAEFVDSGWNVKHIIRTIVTSRSYQQAAAVRSDLVEIDPYNRLLAQQSGRRLEAEIIRDNALAISGLLSADYVGGPSVFPYQPDGHYDNLQFPDRTYTASNDFRQYRRGIYMHWQRTFLHPMLVNFDAPSRDECTADRPLSNSPQQALTLLNDPTFVEAANALAHQLLSKREGATWDELLDEAYLRALSRTASDRERESLAALYARQLEYYQQNVAEAEQLLAVGNHHPTAASGDLPELAGWSQICRVILNLQETITRY